MSQKTAVVLMNLGGPSGEETIKPFLFNFFMDKNIIAAPLPIRWMIAKWIAFSRGKGAALDSYRHLGGVSPLLANTQAQADALQKKLGDDFKVFIHMRYWHPLAPETVAAVKEYGADRIVLLPLYPQFSTTTSFSSIQTWQRAAKAAKLSVPTEMICCYPLNHGFIAASAARIKKAYQEAPAGTRVLFSAHGLPEKIIEGGDPYQWQCEQTAHAIVSELAIPDLDWEICYQSRVGPMAWIGPSTDEALEKAGAEKTGVIIYPHAFVSEHVETLVEIDIEYREKAHHLGVPYFHKVDTVGDDPLFIDGLASEILNGQNRQRICPSTYKRCLCAAKAG